MSLPSVIAARVIQETETFNTTATYSCFIVDNIADYISD